MKIGVNTLRAVLDAAVHENLSTRKDISEALRISKVSVSSAVDSLLNASLLSADGKISSGGRRSECLCPAYSQRYLLMNLCEKPFSFAFAYIGENLTSKGSFYPPVQYITYIDDLDFGDNIAFFANKVAALIDGVPRAVAVAVSGIYDEEKDFFVSDTVEDHAGSRLKEIFSSAGISIDIIASRADAVSNSYCTRSFEKPYAYISVGQKIFGLLCCETRAEFDWSDVKVGALSYSEVLRCALDDEGLAERSQVFIQCIKDVLGARSVLLDTKFLSRSVIDKLSGRLEYLTDVSDHAPVLDGLLSIVASREIFKLHKKESYKSDKSK